jgi:predicted NAD/FAD-binding protein
MNQLQGLKSRHQVCVSLNSDDLIDPDRVLARMRYAHPVYDAEVFAAQRRRHEVSGVDRTWYCGAYWGYGFHEDGVVSALDVCRRLGARAA